MISNESLFLLLNALFNLNVMGTKVGGNLFVVENIEEYIKLSNFDLNTGAITDLVISLNEKLLAIASVNNSSPQLYM